VVVDGATVVVVVVTVGGWVVVVDDSAMVVVEVVAVVGAWVATVETDSGVPSIAPEVSVDSAVHPDETIATSTTIAATRNMSCPFSTPHTMPSQRDTGIGHHPYIIVISSHPDKREPGPPISVRRGGVWCR
jgi:hypothetical protein